MQLLSNNSNHRIKPNQDSLQENQLTIHTNGELITKLNQVLQQQKLKHQQLTTTGAQKQMEVNHQFNRSEP